MSMLATTEQMRELDRRTIEERGIPSLELMENAAREVAQAAADLVGPVKEQSRPDGVIGSAVSVAHYVMMGTAGSPRPEEQREMDEIRAMVESKNTDPTQRIGYILRSWEQRGGRHRRRPHPAGGGLSGPHLSGGRPGEDDPGRPGHGGAAGRGRRRSGALWIWRTAG